MPKTNVSFRGREITVYHKLQVADTSAPCCFCHKPGSSKFRLVIESIIDEFGTTISPKGLFAERVREYMEGQDDMYGKVVCNECTEKILTV